MPSRSLGSFPAGRGFFLGRAMNFMLIRAEYDEQTERAYVELRTPDDDGGESILTAIFSYRTSVTYSKQERKQDIVRKARHMFKWAAAAT